MKQTKILAVLGIVLAMGMTACGNSTPASSGGEGGDSNTVVPSGHVHEYGEWHQTKAPTCEEKGQEQQECACGDVKTRDVKALGHDWGEWSVKTAASCTQDGVEERACKRAGCGKKEERVIKAGHDWDAEQTVAAGADPADQVAYKLANCKKGDAIKVDITAVDAKFYKGKIKSSTPSGYFKLNTTNDKAYWKFTLAGTKMYKGMLYQRGAMDSFSSNTERSYAQTSTSGDHAPKYPLGNFDVVVNGDHLDKTQWIDIPFADLLAEGDDSSAMGDNYSPLCLCPIGECVLQAGLNEITYERLGSYNLIISDLIFIGSEFEHTHAAAETWSSDETGHWHACTALGCPTGKADAVVAHTYEEVAAEGVAATCAAEGKKVEKCSVCGFKKETALPKLAHTLGEAYDVVAATCEAAGSQKKQCSVCNAVIEEVLPKLDHQFGDAVDSYAAGEGYIATTGHNCSVCNKGALRWSARDFDTAESSTDLDLTHDSNKSVRFASGKVENKGGTEAVGSHIIYKINVAAAQEKAGLAFRIKNTSGNNGNADVFGPITNDSSVGYIKNADGTFTESTHRYGLKVNGVEYFLGDNNYGAQSGKSGWFEWPVEFPVKAGVNTIDVFAYRGYRADLYEFELTGLPHVESSHTHNGADAWVSDDNNHWHACTAEGCPLADGKYDVAAHTWGDPVVVEPTVDAAGSKTYTCSVCGKIKVETIAKLSFVQFVGNDFKAGLSSSGTSATGTPKAGGDEFTVYKCSGTYTLTYNSAVAQKVTLRLLLTTKFVNVAAAGVWWQGSTQKFTVKVGETTLDAPFAKEAEPFLSGYGCSVESTAKDGSSSLAVPVWVDMLDIDLAAGDNTIVVTFNGGGYTPWWGGAAFAKAA